MKVRSMLRDLAVAAAAICVTSVLLVSYVAPKAEADHEPANKVAAAGSQLEVVEANQATPTQILQETVKVSSPFDLMLQTTAECSILTALKTGDEPRPAQPPSQASTDSAAAEGQVELFITIDGKVVPVSSDDTVNTGRVVFCNREYQRTVTDNENPYDGQDTESDFIRTRTANAFNWVALDVGFAYDDACAAHSDASPIPGCIATVSNGNNIVEVQLWAEFDKDETTEPQCAGSESDNPIPAGQNSCALGFIGHRTLIAEPTNASIHESVDPVDPAPTATATTPGNGNGNGNGKP